MFVGLCDMLETRGIIVTRTTKDRRDSKVINLAIWHILTENHLYEEKPVAV